MEWKKIKSLQGLYEASPCGSIRSVERFVRTKPKGVESKRKVKSRVLSHVDNGNGYRYVTTSINGKRANHYVHRLVAECFVIGVGEEVNHISGDKSDNRAENLEWVTRRQNTDHAMMTGLVNSGLDHFACNSVIVASDGVCDTYFFGKKHINESGFSSSCVYDCVNHGVKKHKGFSFKRISIDEYRDLVGKGLA